MPKGNVFDEPVAQRARRINALALTPNALLHPPPGLLPPHDNADPDEVPKAALALRPHPEQAQAEATASPKSAGRDGNVQAVLNVFTRTKAGAIAAAKGQ